MPRKTESRSKKKPSTAKKSAAASARPRGVVRAERPAQVKVSVDRALKRAWDGAVAALGAARREGASAFDQLWEAVADIIEHDPPLYLAGGFVTARDFLAKHVGENERTARRNMRVARYASPAEEVRYGTSKLDAALAFVEAKAGGPGAVRGRLPVDFDKLRIPVERKGKAVPVPLGEASVQEIAAATRRLLRGADGSPKTTSPVVKSIARVLAGKSLGGVTVRYAGGRLSLGGIDPASLPALARALARVELPDAPEK